MRTRLLSAALLSFALSLVAVAQAPAYTMSPQRGSASGGTEVTLHAPNAAVVTSVYFGTVVVPATRVNATTLVVTTPAQLPGSGTRTVPVKLWIFGASVNTGLTFTYDDDAEGVFERLLLPVFTPPIAGAFGSEFRTEFRATLAHGGSADIFGLARQCVVLCVEGPDTPHRLTSTFPDLDLSQIEPAGTPGQFIYVPKEELGRVAMNLRVYDTSRSAENFGTEVPIVRENDFATDPSVPLVLVGIPTDARFRNTLRIYSTQPEDLTVSIVGAGAGQQQPVRLRAGGSIFEPAYAEVSNFPVGVGSVVVRIRSARVFLTPPSPYSVWAFVSVTNNETQHITTITPQP